MPPAAAKKAPAKKPAAKKPAAKKPAAKKPASKLTAAGTVPSTYKAHMDEQLVKLRAKYKYVKGSEKNTKSWADIFKEAAAAAKKLAAADAKR